jgi:CheY-like chemotaxis protein
MADCNHALSAIASAFDAISVMSLDDAVKDQASDGMMATARILDNMRRMLATARPGITASTHGWANVGSAQAPASGPALARKPDKQLRADVGLTHATAIVKPPPRVHNPKRDSPPPAMARVLLVDDDDEIRVVMTEILIDAGYEVFEADSADAAYALSLTVPDIDLVVTDVVMPGGDGVGLAKRLRADRPNLPIIFISGFTATHDLSGEKFLMKPFSMPQLTDMVSDCLATLTEPR